MSPQKLTFIIPIADAEIDIDLWNAELFDPATRKVVDMLLEETVTLPAEKRLESFIEHQLFAKPKFNGQHFSSECQFVAEDSVEKLALYFHVTFFDDMVLSQETSASFSRFNAFRQSLQLLACLHRFCWSRRREDADLESFFLRLLQAENQAALYQALRTCVVDRQYAMLQRAFEAARLGFPTQSILELLTHHEAHQCRQQRL